MISTIIILISLTGTTLSNQINSSTMTEMTSKEISKGMNHEQVIKNIGEPLETISLQRSSGLYEIWSYPNGKFLFFKNKKLESIKTYQSEETADSHPEFYIRHEIPFNSREISKIRKKYYQQQASGNNEYVFNPTFPCTG